MEIMQSTTQNKRVGYFLHQKSGCYYYRIKQKMDALERAGVPTQMLELEKDIQIDELQSIQLYGLYPFRFAEVLKYVKDKGIKVVYDLDDPMDLIDESNPFYQSVKRDTWSFGEILPFADEVTVSTPAMAEYITKARSDVKVTVVSNTYDSNDWLFERPKREGIRIGFAGGAPHVSSLLKVIPVLKSLQTKYDTRFLIFGLGDNTVSSFLRDFRMSATGKAVEDIIELEKQLQGLKFEWTPFVDYEKYFPTLKNMALDIGLCPLEDTEFNKCRSASKAMEYVLSGAVAIASDVEAFRNDPTSVLVKDNWYDVIEQYIVDSKLREAKRVESLQWIMDNRNVDNQVDLLKSIYVV